MSDATLRDLERALTLAPGDGRARLELARELLRLGRRREALDRLELSLVRDPWFAEAKTLSEELWREETAKLEAVLAIPTARPMDVLADLTGRFVAWTDAAHRLSVAALDTGRVVFESRNAVHRFFAARGRFLANHIIDGDARGPAFVACSESGVAIEHLATEAPFGVRGVSPDGTRVVGEVVHEDHEASGIYEAATGRPLVEMTTDERAGADVDWDGSIASLRRHDSVRFRRFSGELLAGGQATQGAARLVGRGLVAEPWQGLRLRSLEHDWKLSLATARGPAEDVNLASDGRGVRFVLRERPRRVDVDLETGALLSPRIDGLREATATEPRRVVAWHPHADLVAESRRRGPAVESVLATLEGAVVRELPRATEPLAWTADGHGLLCVVHEGRSGEARIELWRPPDLRPATAQVGPPR